MSVFNLVTDRCNFRWAWKRSADLRDREIFVGRSVGVGQLISRAAVTHGTIAPTLASFFRETEDGSRLFVKEMTNRFREIIRKPFALKTWDHVLTSVCKSKHFRACGYLVGSNFGLLTHAESCKPANQIQRAKIIEQSRLILWRTICCAKSAAVPEKEAIAHFSSSKLLISRNLR